MCICGLDIVHVPESMSSLQQAGATFGVDILHMMMNDDDSLEDGIFGSSKQCAGVSFRR